MKNVIKIATGVAVLAAMLIAPLSQEAHAERGSWMPIEVNIEGKMLKMPTNPVVESGTTLVPMRAIFEALGAEIKWDNKTQTVTGTKDSTKVELTIGSKTAKKNGVSSQLIVAPKLVDGNTMIPLRYVSESLDMHVAWIASERQVYIAKDRSVEGTTMASVEALFDKYAPTFTGARFTEQSSHSNPYKAGTLSDGFLQDGLKAANLVRIMAGLPTVTLDSNLTEKAQYGASLSVATDQFTHTPTKPSDMSEDFFQKAYDGTNNSNLAGVPQNSTPSELADGVKQMTIDSGVSGVGHRRWILNPMLSKVGFGYDSKVNASNKNVVSGDVLMYVTDKSQLSKPDYDYIAWPSKGYYPISWVTPGMDWSVTLNPDKYQMPNVTEIGGTVTNLVDGSVLKLVSGQTPVFTAMYDRVNGTSTIVFPVKDNDHYWDEANAGDEFVIELNGIYKTDGTPATVKYTVKLFAME